MDCNIYTTESGQALELLVVAPADDSKPGIYRMQTVS